MDFFRLATKLLKFKTTKALEGAYPNYSEYKNSWLSSWESLKMVKTLNQNIS